MARPWINFSRNVFVFRIKFDVRYKRPIAATRWCSIIPNSIQRCDAWLIDVQNRITVHVGSFCGPTPVWWCPLPSLWPPCQQSPWSAPFFSSRRAPLPPFWFQSSPLRRSSLRNRIKMRRWINCICMNVCMLFMRFSWGYGHVRWRGFIERDKTSLYLKLFCCKTSLYLKLFSCMPLQCSNCNVRIVDVAGVLCVIQ